MVRDKVATDAEADKETSVVEKVDLDQVTAEGVLQVRFHIFLSKALVLWNNIPQGKVTTNTMRTDPSSEEPPATQPRGRRQDGECVVC